MKIQFFSVFEIIYSEHNSPIVKHAWTSTISPLRNLSRKHDHNKEKTIRNDLTT